MQNPWGWSYGTGLDFLSGFWPFTFDLWYGPATSLWVLAKHTPSEGRFRGGQWLLLHNVSGFFSHGKLQAADKKSKATFPRHLQRGGFGGQGYPSLYSMSATFCKQVLFSLSFASFFFFKLSLRKFLIFIDIFFIIQNKISILYTILSFLTMYRSAKKSTFIPYIPARACKWPTAWGGLGSSMVKPPHPPSHASVPCLLTSGPKSSDRMIICSFFFFLL